MTTTSLLDSVNIELPSTREDDYNHEEYLEYLHNIQKRNINIESRAGSYIHGITAVSDAYVGGVYSPTQNRIYLVPNCQSNQTNWHYIDCNTGTVVAYAAPVGDIPLAGAYMGGVYSPTQNRIYFVPYSQTTQENWHYIDCNTGTVVAYASGVTSDSFYGGVYSPTQNRIYLVPAGQADEATWYYIDCTSTGSVHAYTHGITAVDYAYWGGVYSPTQNRIYLVPYYQADETNWHYIDCTSTGSVHAYQNNSGVAAVNYAYYGGVYSPTQNRIYLVPVGQADETNWHYIDCNTGNIVAYTHGVTAVSGAYEGGVYSPTQNRIYLVPSIQATNWHYIQEFSNEKISRQLMSGTLFNKFQGKQ